MAKERSPCVPNMLPNKGIYLNSFEELVLQTSHELNQNVFFFSTENSEFIKKTTFHFPLQKFNDASKQ